MTSPRQRFGSVLTLLILAGVVSGCASFGMRPAEPPMGGKVADACEAYSKYEIYAQELQEAYHSRATQNRGWIYVAGILGLGVAAASGGLAVASTVGAGTLGLLAISGGFAGGSFATINNEALALSYTVAANDIDKALKNSRATLLAGGTCAAALSTLNTSVSDARTQIEVKRTDNAAGALGRARDQQKLLNDQIAAVESTDLTHVTLAAAIVDVAPLAPQAGQVTSVTITVKNVKLDQVGLRDVKVAFGTKQLDADAIAQPDAVNNPTTYTVKFTPSATPPDANQKTYLPALILQGKTRIPGKTGKEFVYP